MFPWADTVARRYPPIVVWSVIGISALALLYQVGLPPRVLDRFLFDFALVPSRFFGQLSLVAPSDWTPFLTDIFLHAGWLHLILNRWTLWIFGPAVEDRLGPVRFALFYLFCGVAAGLAHALAYPQLGRARPRRVRCHRGGDRVLCPDVPGGPDRRDRADPGQVSALAFAMIWFAMQVIPGLMSLGYTASGGIAWWAHIGGFVAGWLATPLLRRPAGAHRRYYRDEGIYGFLPDGRRQGGGSPWI